MQGAVQLVIETGKPIAEVARDLGMNEGTLGNWCAKERRARKKDGSLIQTSGPSWSVCVAM
jgi:transposase